MGCMAHVVCVDRGNGDMGSMGVLGGWRNKDMGCMTPVLCFERG
jgi:hypothetical protein